ncbi:hypothetical protein [Microbacterium sp. NPDC055599]
MVDHLDLKMSYAQLVRLIKDQTTALIQRSGIGSAGLRVHSGGFITIENGGLDVTGTATVAGILTGSGTFDWWGPSVLRGTVNVTGDLYTSGQMGIAGLLTVAGATTLNGAVTMNNDLTLGTGRILAGPLRIDRAGGYGGRVYSSSILVLEAANAVLIPNDVDIRGILLTDGLDVDGPKNFRIAHPTKAGYWLRHGSTESPVSGTEYKGTAAIGPDGSVVVELPEYFEALNKPGGRTVHVTAVGRPFLVGADKPRDGKVTIYGDPGREVDWIVKAEREGADFPLEEKIPTEPEPTPEPEQPQEPESTADEPASIWELPGVRAGEE